MPFAEGAISGDAIRTGVTALLLRSPCKWRNAYVKEQSAIFVKAYLFSTINSPLKSGVIAAFKINWAPHFLYGVKATFPLVVWTNNAVSASISVGIQYPAFIRPDHTLILEIP